MRILFIGHSGYGYPHTRVRCYHFAKILSTMPGIETGVLSFKDDLAPHHSEAAMYESLRDREKLWLSWKALRRLVDESQSVLYIQKAHFHAAAPYLLYRLGWLRNYIFDYDDYDIPLSNFFGRGIWNRLWFGTNRWDEITFQIARGARGCVVASHGLQELLEPVNPNVAYVPTGVDAAAFQPAPEKTGGQPLTFLWNGLVWGPPIVENLRFLFRAYDWVAHQMPEARLLIIGGGAQWQEVRDLAQEQFSHLPIEWVEWVKPENMPRLLQSADVALLPAAGDDLWLRCKSPTKLFEYMASGLPVVASDTGEASHVVHHLQTGMLAADEREFGQAMLRLANNRAMRAEFGQKARLTITQNYALPVLGENLYTFFQKTFPEEFSV